MFFSVKPTGVWWIMRISLATLMIIFTASLQLFAAGTVKSQDVDKVEISLELKNKSLVAVFRQIEEKTPFHFMYRNQDVENVKNINVSPGKQTVAAILKSILTNTTLDFRQIDDHILIVTRTMPSIKPDVAKLDIMDIVVRGVVSDGQGKALEGVSIKLKGTENGTVTDAQGAFSLRAPENGVLVFTYVGYVTQELSVDSKTTLSVKMVEEFSSLNQVVVTGYSSQSKKDITGSVVSIDAKELNKVSSPNLAQQLQGRSTGVTVTSSNIPGGEPTVRIRGFGTVNNNEPLYVIDGVPTKGGLNNINPNNIESMQILKDASAASIYGSRAANGVIIITTKKGKAGESRLTFDARYGVQSSRGNSNIDVIKDPLQFGQLRWTQLRNAGQLTNGNPVDPQYGNGADPVVPDYILAGTRFGLFEGDPAVDPALYKYSADNMYQITKANKAGTNWFDEIMRPAAPMQEYNIGASGGTEKGRYAFGINYFNQDGILRFTSFERYSVRANTEFTVKKRLRIGENLEAGQSENKGFFTNNAANNSDGNPVGNAYRMPSIMPVYDIMGNYAGTRASGLGSAQNPLAQLDRGRDNSLKNSKVFGNLYAEVDIIKGLTARTSYGFDYQATDGVIYDLYNLEAAAPIAQDRLTNSRATDITTTWSNTINYKTNINDVHDIQVLLGTEAIEGVQRSYQASRDGFISEDPHYMYLDAGSLALNNAGTGSEWALFSLFGKINYKFHDRYLLEATLRRDGSSRFGKNNRYGMFPAFSAGWRISQEQFMQNVGWIQNLNLRAAWGKTGNQEIGNYNAFTTYRTSLSLSSYDMAGSNNTVFAGFDRQSFGNPDARWETTTQTNIGLDASFLQGKVGVTVDWFDKTTSDMLYQVRRAAIMGEATLPFVNIGSMRNKGLEVGVSYKNKALNGDFTYEISGNISTYKNEVIELSGNQNEMLIAPEIRSQSYVRSAAGMPIYSFYGFVIDGIFQNEKEVQDHASYPGYAEVKDGVTRGVGKFKYRDLNGDNVINDLDRTFIGSPHPDFTYGLNINLGYKNFDLTMFFQGVQGNDMISFVRRLIDFNELGNNRSMRMLTQSWTPGSTNAILPILDASDNLSLRPSSYFVEDGSYLRMKVLQLGYNLPANLMSRIGLERVRIYAQAQNLFTITNYSGLDPEVNFTGTGTTSQMGIDQGVYPAAKVYQLGISVGL
jgi:TonB-linked SusC/RagA family outer membrane protein